MKLRANFDHLRIFVFKVFFNHGEGDHNETSQIESHSSASSKVNLEARTDLNSKYIQGDLLIYITDSLHTHSHTQPHTLSHSHPFSLYSNYLYPHTQPRWPNESRPFRVVAAAQCSSWSKSIRLNDKLEMGAIRSLEFFPRTPRMLINTLFNRQKRNLVRI